MDKILLSDGVRGIYTQLHAIKTLKRMEKEGSLEVFSAGIKLDGEFMSTFQKMSTMISMRWILKYLKNLSLNLMTIFTC